METPIIILSGFARRMEHIRRYLSRQRFSLRSGDVARTDNVTGSNHQTPFLGMVEGGRGMAVLVDSPRRVMTSRTEFCRNQRIKECELT